VFDHLSLEDIKSCREVSSFWNTVAWDIMKKKARIEIWNPACKCILYEKCPMLLPAIIFRRRRGCYCDWTSLDIANLFQELQETTKELTLWDIDFKNELYLDNFINLTVLKIYNCNTQTEMNLETLKTVSFLELENVTINTSALTEKIRVKKLSLSFVTFNSNRDEKIVFNSCYDFSKALTVRLHDINKPVKPQ